MNYEEIETPINEKVDLEIYNKVKEELKQAKNKNSELKDDLEEVQADLKAIVDTIVEYGNKFEFIYAYPKLIEFLKGREFI